MRICRLSGRERVNRMFARADQDCLPRMESFWDDTIRRFRAEGFAGDPNDYLGSDFRGLCWSEPSAYRGELPVLSEDDDTITVRERWGEVVRLWKRRNGTPEHLSFPCHDRDEWECDYKPRLLANPPSVNLDASLRDFALGRREGRWLHLTAIETFEMTRHFFGDETTMILMIEDPDLIREASATVTDLVLRDFDYLWDNGVRADGVFVYGDMAFRSGVLCGPPLYRELIWPDHKRLVDWAHARDLPFIYHTDGDVNAIIEDYIGAGVDCLQPLEAKAGMDVRQLCPRYGDRLAFFGNCDVMIYATGDRDAIEEEIRSKCEAGKATRGYAYHSDHSIPPSVSWETFQFVVDCVDRYGNYD